MPKISIIIPAYNAGKTLAATVESILAQTLTNFELWIVDDGSTDNTGRIADSFAARDNRIHVIHQENQGAFMARVNGIKVSRSEYIGFVDADDTIRAEMFAKMVAFADANSLDVAQSDCISNGRLRSPEVIVGKDNVLNHVVRPWLFEGNGPAFVWDKIYRRKCAHVDIAPMRSSAFEDLVLNMYLFLSVGRFGFLHEYLYNYEQSSTSTTRNFSNANVEGFRLAVEARYTFAARYGIDVSEPLFYRWILLNAGNLVRQAACSSSMAMSVSSGHIKAVLSLEEVQEAMRNVPKSAHFLCCVSNCPWAYVAKTRIVAKIRKFAKLCMGRN